MPHIISRWNPGEGCKVRKFTLKYWYRRSLKDANPLGWKTVCRRSESGEHPPENIHVSFLPTIRHGKARKMDVGIPENRSQQIEKSFAAERKIVRLRLKNHSAEIEKSFGAELFTISCKERRLKDARNIFQRVTSILWTDYHVTWKMKDLFVKSLCRYPKGYHQICFPSS